MVQSRNLTSGTLSHFTPEEAFVQSSQEWIRTGKKLAEQDGQGPKKEKQADDKFVDKV